jgi:hypothetical protein
MIKKLFDLLFWSHEIWPPDPESCQWRRKLKRNYTYKIILLENIYSFTINFIVLNFLFNLSFQKRKQSTEWTDTNEKISTKKFNRCKLDRHRLRLQRPLLLPPRLAPPLLLPVLPLPLGLPKTRESSNYKITSQILILILYFWETNERSYTTHWKISKKRNQTYL